ncbi:MAG: adaptor protein MecA [Lachnospiraceae bacterium]|nr:adaptor protein MecA [Lachnospiraceae bacterium]
MKIEKINENQIRCTLTSADLSDRHIDLNELAYGSGKARQLFHEMIEKAYHDLGFDVEDSPLVVEAIPLPMNSIMLIISKIEEPEELDGRYSRFAPCVEEDVVGDLMALPVQVLEGAVDEIRKQFAQHIPLAKRAAAHDSEDESDAPAADALRLYSFTSLRELARAATLLEFPEDTCHSSLYRLDSGRYDLVIAPIGSPSASYSRICNVLAEFGTKLHGGLSAAAYHEEHYEKILEQNALSVIAKLY